MLTQQSNISDLFPTQTSNPLADLSEFVKSRNVIDYAVVEQKGLRNPIFKMSVEVDGKLFFGLGNSKKAAKCAAARGCLKYFRHFPNNKSPCESILADDGSLSIGKEGNEIKVLTKMVISIV